MPTQNPLIEHDGIQPREVVDISHEMARRQFEKAAEGLPFAGMFVLLLDEGWYWRDAAYIAWKSTPRKFRQPEKLYELEEMLGMANGSMTKRRQKNPAVDLRVSQGIVTNTLFDETDGVIEALVDSAQNPNYKHHPDRKMFLEMVGAYVPKQAIDVDVGAKGVDMSTKSDEDLRRMASKAGSADKSLLDSGEGE